MTSIDKIIQKLLSHIAYYREMANMQLLGSEARRIYGGYINSLKGVIEDLEALGKELQKKEDRMVEGIYCHCLRIAKGYAFENFVSKRDKGKEEAYWGVVKYIDELRREQEVKNEAVSKTQNY